MSSPMMTRMFDAASEIGRLANTHNDVALLEQALKGLGFEVVIVLDVGLGVLHQAIISYARRLQIAGPSAVGFFCYSSHGASDGGTNFLIPVDVKTTEAGDLGSIAPPHGDHAQAQKRSG